MIHQLQHGRRQILGLLSRTPARLVAPRLADPVIGPLLGAAPLPGLPPAVSAAWLRHRWNVAFVVSPGFPEPAARARALGFPEIGRSDRGDLAVVYRVPEEVVPAVAGVIFHEVAGDPAGGRKRGIFFEGLFGPERVPWGGPPEAGCWTGSEVLLLIPLAPGTYRLRLAGPPETRPAVAIRWGMRSAAATIGPFKGISEISLRVSPEDRAPDGTVSFALSVAPALRENWKGGRELGVFLISLSK
jgi:hypothetical protein